MAKTVSSWKNKKRYNILAPDTFDNKSLGETVATSDDKIIGRTVDTSLGMLLDERGKQHLKLVFQATEVSGETVKTRFKKFFIPTGYMRSKVRKGMSKLDYINDVHFKDLNARVKIVVLTRNKISSDQKTQIVKTVDMILKAHQSKNLDHLLQLTLFGKLGTEIYKKCKKLLPIIRVEVHEVSLVN